jgi:hypothetical protein
MCGMLLNVTVQGTWHTRSRHCLWNLLLWLCSMQPHIAVTLP